MYSVEAETTWRRIHQWCNPKPLTKINLGFSTGQTRSSWTAPVIWRLTCHKRKKSIESLRLMRINVFGWVSSKIWRFHMRGLHGVTKMARWSCRRTRSSSRSTETGNGRPIGKYKRTRTSMIRMAGVTPMTSTAHSKTLEASSTLSEDANGCEFHQRQQRYPSRPSTSILIQIRCSCLRITRASTKTIKCVIVSTRDKLLMRSMYLQCFVVPVVTKTTFRIDINLVKSLNWRKKMKCWFNSRYLC